MRRPHLWEQTENLPLPMSNQQPSLETIPKLLAVEPKPLPSTHRKPYISHHKSSKPYSPDRMQHCYKGSCAQEAVSRWRCSLLCHSTLPLKAHRQMHHSGHREHKPPSQQSPHANCSSDNVHSHSRPIAKDHKPQESKPLQTEHPPSYYRLRWCVTYSGHPSPDSKPPTCTLTSHRHYS